MKTDKTEMSDPITTSESFIFNANRNRIGYFLAESIPSTDAELQEKYQYSLQSIYDSTNGFYLMETDAYRLIIEIRNI